MKKLLAVFVFSSLVPFISDTASPPLARTNSISAVVRRMSMNETIIRRQIHVESSNRPHVIGKHGEVGLMQIKPTTATEIRGHVVTIHDLKDSLYNVETGILYLKRIERFFSAVGFRNKALQKLTWSAYNEGPGITIRRHWKQPMSYRLERAYRKYAEKGTLPSKLQKLPKTYANVYAGKILR
jgi:soluble lytic murein transglycosylase-like protein